MVSFENTMPTSPGSPWGGEVKWEECPMSPLEHYLKATSPGAGLRDLHRDRFVALGARFPARAALDLMPDELRREVEAIAQQRLKERFIPALYLFKMRLRRWERNKTFSSHSVIHSCMQKSELLNLWPAHHAAQLEQHVIPYVAAPLEVVLYEGETCASGIWCLLKGTAHVVKKGNPTKRVSATHPANAILNRIDAPAVIGDFTQVTGQPRTATILALSECEWGVIPKVHFDAELAKLPEPVRKKVYEVTHAKQRAILWTMYAITPSEMRRSFLFKHFSNEQLHSVIRRLRSRCYKVGDSLCELDQPGSDMFFLRNGEVEVLVPAPVDASLPRSHNAERPLRRVNILEPGACFGEMSLIFGERRSATIRATKHCDVFTLALEDLEPAFYEDQDLHMKVHNAASEQRKRWLKNQETLWRARNVARTATTTDARLQAHADESDEVLQHLSRCPVLRDVCPRVALAHLREFCEPRCLPQRTAVVSSADICDRIVVMTRGRAIVQQTRTPQRQYLHPGEPVGFTCIAEHRWLHAVVTVDVCDIWELPRSRLIEVLKVHGCYDRALRIVRALLRGDTIAQASIGQKTPPLFPTARDKDANKLLGYQAGTSARGRVSVEPTRSPAKQTLEVSPAPSPATLSLQKDFPLSEQIRQRRASVLPSPGTRRLTLPPAGAQQNGRRASQSISLPAAFRIFDDDGDDVESVGSRPPGVAEGRSSISAPRSRSPSVRRLSAAPTVPTASGAASEQTGSDTETIPAVDHNDDLAAQLVWAEERARQRKARAHQRARERRRSTRALRPLPVALSSECRPGHVLPHALAALEASAASAPLKKPSKLRQKKMLPDPRLLRLARMQTRKLTSVSRRPPTRSPEPLAAAAQDAQPKALTMPRPQSAPDGGSPALSASMHAVVELGRPTTAKLPPPMHLPPRAAQMLVDSVWHHALTAAAAATIPLSPHLRHAIPGKRNRPAWRD